MDYLRLGPELDLVANDHYLTAHDPDAHVELSWAPTSPAASRGGRPWLLMEHSTSAVNWQPRNVAKAPGQMLRNSLAHVARGADAVCFFQWRASRAGAEKFHSALLPHAGTDSRVWREVVELGADLERDRRGRRLPGARPRSRSSSTGRPGGPPSWTATPRVDLEYLDRHQALYRALWDAGVTVDMVAPGGRPHRLPAGPRADAVPRRPTPAPPTSARYVDGGGTALVTYCSGIVDEHDHVRLGGYPGAFRDLLGVRTEEFSPLREGETVRLAGGVLDGAAADVWTEAARTSWRRGGLDLRRRPAARRTRPDRQQQRGRERRGTSPPGSTPRPQPRSCATCATPPASSVHDQPGVEAVRRYGAQASYLFVLNHTDQPATVDAPGTDLLTGTTCTGTVEVAAGGVAVVREEGA